MCWTGGTFIVRSDPDSIPDAVWGSETWYYQHLITAIFLQYVTNYDYREAFKKNMIIKGNYNTFIDKVGFYAYNGLICPELQRNVFPFVRECQKLKRIVYELPHLNYHRKKEPSQNTLVREGESLGWELRAILSINQSVFGNDKFVKIMQDFTRQRKILRSEIMLLLIYSLISKERGIV